MENLIGNVIISRNAFFLTYHIYFIKINYFHVEFTFFNSQDVPEEWNNVLPKNVVNSIKNNDNKGDFIAVINRKGNEAEENMSKMFKTYFDHIKRPNPKKYKCHNFQLTKMPLNHVPSTDEMAQNSHFWRSDHSRFWYHNSNPFRSFNSIALSDTGKYILILCNCKKKIQNTC